MNTQQKTAAIQKIFANHQDNVTPVRAAQVGSTFDTEVTTALTNALKSELEKVFALSADASLSQNTPVALRRSNRKSAG